MAGGVLVFAEQRGGALKKSALEAVSAGRRLAEQMGGPLAVLVAGSGVGPLAAGVARYGARRVLVADDPALATYSTEGYAEALSQAIASESPAAVLMSCTAMGRDLIPRVAARCSASAAMDVVELDAPGGRLVAKRPVYSGKAYATVEFSGVVLATLRPNVFPAVDLGPADCEIVPLRVAVPEGKLRARVARVEGAERKEPDVAEADVIVAAGRGLKGPENLALVRGLAEALGGAVGASRAIVDAGWIGHAHQVGQTGKVVAPVLYVACGISGAVQHLAGMSTARVVVAINKDPEAPIFKIATYGIVGDVFEILPRLTEEIRRLRAE